MNKKNPVLAGPAAPELPTERARPKRSPFSSGAVRETVESLVVAFVLAFLFRTFDAEAFVIPTGSMAPTLMGQHKDVVCPQCHFQYQAGASGEAEDLARQRGRFGTARDVIAVTCPMCRYPLSVDPRTATGREYPTFGGDRILVAKDSYDFYAPHRWDVLVLKYPAEAQTNYIKRLVGLPEETVRLWHGDLLVRPNGESAFQIARRDPDKLRSMAQIVYDNDYLVESLAEKRWPVRWQPLEEAGWTTTDGSRSFSIDGHNEEPAWLRYQHYYPSIDEWEMLKDGPLPAGYEPKPRLITDFYAYDTSVSRGEPMKEARQLGLHWVGDLMVEGEFEVSSSKGSILLELIKGGRHFRATIDVSTGEATLSIDGLSSFSPRAQTAVRGVGTHRVTFANVDQQLLLWVNGKAIQFDGENGRYEELDNEVPRSTPDDAGDLAPARIGAQGAAVRVNHLKLWRDIYYIAAQGRDLSDYEFPQSRLGHMSYDELLAFWSTPSRWDPKGDTNPFLSRRKIDFPLAKDQYFVLGDNSPMSQDARLWAGERYVDRDLIVGKALLIFWPHSFHELPGTDVPFPFFPNFARIGFIR